MASVWAMEKKHTSYALGGKYTPFVNNLEWRLLNVCFAFSCKSEGFFTGSSWKTTQNIDSILGIWALYPESVKIVCNWSVNVSLFADKSL